MIQRFLFNRINSKTTGPTITGHDKLVIQILPDEAQTTLVFVQLAKPRTEIALNTAIIQAVPIACFHCVMGNKSSHYHSPGTVNKSSCQNTALTCNICGKDISIKYLLLICKDYYKSFTEK
jgi:hypothetical protein